MHASPHAAKCCSGGHTATAVRRDFLIMPILATAVRRPRGSGPSACQDCCCWPRYSAWWGSVVVLAGSFYLRLPSGATIVLTVAIMFAVSFAIVAYTSGADAERPRPSSATRAASLTQATPPSPMNWGSGVTRPLATSARNEPFSPWTRSKRHGR
jgi:hypothetical protein